MQLLIRFFFSVVNPASKHDLRILEENISKF